MLVECLDVASCRLLDALNVIPPSSVAIARMVIEVHLSCPLSTAVPSVVCPDILAEIGARLRTVCVFLLKTSGSLLERLPYCGIRKTSQEIFSEDLLRRSS